MYNFVVTIIMLVLIVACGLFGIGSGGIILITIFMIILLSIKPAIRNTKLSKLKLRAKTPPAPHEFGDIILDGQVISDRSHGILDPSKMSTKPCV